MKTTQALLCFLLAALSCDVFAFNQKPNEAPIIEMTAQDELIQEDFFDDIAPCALVQHLEQQAKAMLAQERVQRSNLRASFVTLVGRPFFDHIGAFFLFRNTDVNQLFWTLRGIVETHRALLQNAPSDIVDRFIKNVEAQYLPNNLNYYFARLVYDYRYHYSRMFWHYHTQIDGQVVMIFQSSIFN